MKKIMYTFSLLAIPFSTLNAQEKTTVFKSPDLVIGLHAGVSTECLCKDSAVLYHARSKQNSVYPLAGIFARYTLSRHFALQAGADVSFTKTVPGYAYANTSSNLPAFMSFDVKTTIVDVPLLLQYYLLQPESRIRPYFGAGLTTRFLTYKMDGISKDVNNKVEPYGASKNHIEYYPAITEGITWQINNKWQFNQSLNYMRNGNSGILSLKLGVAFTIK